MCVIDSHARPHACTTSVVMRGWCQGPGYRVGFGVCEGKVLPAGTDPVAVRSAPLCPALPRQHNTTVFFGTTFSTALPRLTLDLRRAL